MAKLTVTLTVNDVAKGKSVESQFDFSYKFNWANRPESSGAELKPLSGKSGLEVVYAGVLHVMPVPPKQASTTVFSGKEKSLDFLLKFVNKGPSEIGQTEVTIYAPYIEDRLEPNVVRKENLIVVSA